MSVPAGPNVRKLIVRKLALDAIPAGGGIVEGIRFLSDPSRVAATARDATAWAAEMIDAVRRADPPNPWVGATDEEIAGEILRQVDARKGGGP